MKTVLVAGEINVDLIFGNCGAMPRPDTETVAEIFRRVPGSSSMICAMGLARLGDAVLFAGCAGHDGNGTYCVTALREAGVDVHAVRLDADLETGVTTVLSTRTDRALVTFPGSIGALRAVDVDDTLLGRARHLHVSSFYLQRSLRPGLPELFGRAKRLGLTTSLDPGYDPDRRWKQGDEWARLLPYVDIFMPNRREMCTISEQGSAEAALSMFANGPMCTVVKCGADGAMARSADGEVLRVRTRAPRKGVVDSTGAGDSFDAGFLHAWLGGLPLDDCLRWGNACGSLSTRGFGGTATQPDVAEATRWLEACA